MRLFRALAHWWRQGSAILPLTVDHVRTHGTWTSRVEAYLSPQDWQDLQARTTQTPVDSADPRFILGRLARVWQPVADAIHDRPTVWVRPPFPSTPPAVTITITATGVITFTRGPAVPAAHTWVFVERASAGPSPL